MCMSSILGPVPHQFTDLDRSHRPRNGQDIGWWQLICALHEVYNLSYPLAILLATVGVLLCGRWYHLPWTLSLHELARHNAIEHDCSLAHADAAPGAKFAPYHTDRTLLCRLLETSVTQKLLPLGMADFVAARIRRALEVRKDIGSLHREIAHGETALTMLTMGKVPDGMEDCKDKELVVPREFIRVWFGSDRLPDCWEKPKKEIGMFRAKALSGVVKNEIFRRNYISQCA